MITEQNIFFLHYYRHGYGELMEFNDDGDIIWWITMEGLQNYKWN